MTKKNLPLAEGESINNWIVIKEYGVRNRVRHYFVHCFCGNESIKTAAQIRKNIECFQCSRKRQSDNGGTRRTHGACSNSSEIFSTYMAWNYMKSRCAGRTKKNYKNYVERNIKVCDRWINSFENFIQDMGKKPENSSLDRIDNDKGYYPENCRWASITEQNDNKRGCIYYEYNGEKMTIARWAEKWGITRSKATEWLKREGIAWVVKNLHLIKACYPRMSNEEYEKIGLTFRKGHGQRKHSASRNPNHPLHKMYKSWDYMKKYPICEAWHDFMNFVNDMGEKPIDKRLRRINTNLPFSKENCYWGN